METKNPFKREEPNFLMQG